MRFRAILNKEGGTLRTANIELLKERIGEAFAAAGRDVEFEIVAGKGLTAALDKAVEDEDVEGVLIGGGDGSVSCAAGKLTNSVKALAVLPAGTMNLFARSLKIPLDLDQAIEALAEAPVTDVDIATANGRPFVHQYSIGMHAKLVALRDKKAFASRIGKIRASAVAAFDTILNPPRFRLELTLPGGTEIEARTSSIAVTNNLYGEGHIPYTDTPDGGTLGIYIAKARSRRDMAAFLTALAMGRWKTNQQVEVHQSHEVGLRIKSAYRRHKCVIDGELSPLEQRILFKIHPGALKVLRPPAPEA